MKSNRGPGAVAPPPNFQNDSAYYKSRDSGNAYAWAQKSNASAGGVGGSWASTPSVSSQARQPSYTEQHQLKPSITVTGDASAPTNTTGSGGTAVADGSYEKQLIMELCPPGGMKAEPPPDKLNQFARSVSNLNPDLVCPVLLDCLEDGQPWIIRAKALCVMECCIRNGQKPDGSSNPYSDFFHACGGEIAPLANHTRIAIRDPAKRVMGLLGIAILVGNAAAPPVQEAQPPPATAPNLLDFGDTETPPTAMPQQPPPAPSGGGGDSLFGGLTVASSQAPTAVPAPTSAPPATAPLPAAPTSGNLLGDFTVLSEANTASGSSSLFGGMDIKTNAPVPASNEVSQTSSMFENLSVKAPARPGKGTEPADMPTGSAFGFINEASSSDAVDKNENESAPSGPPVPATWDTFDPLKNVTPNTAKQMMQVSPQQMQAMAYQQMMMQQQMQMAQMMAIQQQRGSGTMFRQMSGNMSGQMVMQNPAAAKTSFAFLDGKAEKQDDKSFDFVKDAMTMEKKK
jgi:hypothetical protein